MLFSDEWVEKDGSRRKSHEFVKPMAPASGGESDEDADTVGPQLCKAQRAPAKICRKTLVDKVIKVGHL